jgi:hypothetical protein
MIFSRRNLALLILGGTILLLAFVGSASAQLVHRQEGTFPLTGINFVAIDNSAGPSSGDLYLGESEFGTAESKVYQADGSGAPTGVELDGAETPDGSFGFIDTTEFRVATGPAVDGSTGANAGDVYVPDVIHGVVDRFDESGAYLCQITGDATPSASECAGATGSETPAGGLEPRAVTVDPGSGTVAVADARGSVYEFDEAGKLVRAISVPQITEPRSLAFDSIGDLYVVNGSFFTPGTVVEVDPAGAFLRSFTPESNTVGVDLGNDHSYLGAISETPIQEFDESGAAVTSFGSGALSIAVSKSTGRIYVTPLSGEGQIWGKLVVAPNVVTGAATTVEETDATVTGSVDPEVLAGGGAITSCEFEYGTEETYGESAPCDPAVPYSTATAVKASLGSLEPSTTYHYRLVVESATGVREAGADRTVTTSGSPGVSGEIAIARTTSATVKAQVNTFGFPANCLVEFVDAAGFEASEFAAAKSTDCSQALPASFEPQTATATLTGLRIGTIYHYRFRVTNQAGSELGEEATFSTFGIESFAVEPFDRQGSPITQAGSHPYAMRVSFSLTTTEPESNAEPRSVTANLRTVQVHLPPGLIGNPRAVPQCRPDQLSPRECPAPSQVGMATVQSARGVSEFGPVYNLLPPEGVAAQLGARFNALASVRIDAGVRTGSDYGIDTDSIFVTADEGVERVEVTIWGVPADESHFAERFCPGAGLPECASGAPLKPFLTTPTSCTGPLLASLAVDAWQEPGNFVSADAEMPAMAGCGRLDFSPSIQAQPETTASDSPTGLRVNLHLPQNENPAGLAEANLRDAVVTLPKGVVVNPSSAKGLGACSEAEIELHGPEPARCPDSSKLGEVEIHTPLLDHPVPGAIYLARQGENPFNSLIALYIAVHDPVSGVVVKLPGKVELDPASGQATARFTQNPQLPFEDLEASFYGGPQGSLTTPPTCGTYTTETDLTPWTAPEGEDARPSSSFGVGGSCPTSEAQMPNAPGFEAGTATPLANAYSPFVLKLSRQNGSQRFSRIDATLPEGLLGKLAGVATCSDSQIAAAEARGGLGQGAAEKGTPSCPAASEVGTVNVGAGSGDPFFVGGHAYLAGPYKGAPLSLEIITPAVAGPFDLGTVAVRTALYVNESTAQIHAVSDPIPSILAGIPLDVRVIELNVSRPEFTRNPTSCDPKQIVGTETSTLGQTVALGDRFQVGGCRGLAFKPALKLSFTGQTKRLGNPAVKAVLTQPKGDNANIAKTAVILPKGLLIDNAHINNPCTRVQFNSTPTPGEGCPAKSVLGTAKVWTPLLDSPEEGNVYFRSNGGERQLPDLVVALRGRIPIQLVGFIDSVGRKGAEVRRVRTRFLGIPDAPVSRFELKLAGGKRGLLENSHDLCTGSDKATFQLTGQNGKAHDTEPKVGVSCPRRGGGKAGGGKKASAPKGK